MSGKIHTGSDGSRREWHSGGALDRPGAPNEVHYGANGLVTFEAWTDADGEFSRSGGPATIGYGPDGVTVEQEQWVFGGVAHRIGGPAITDKDGSMHYFVRGASHRDDGPASDFPKGSGRPRRFYLRDVSCTATEFLRRTNRTPPVPEHVKDVDAAAERGEIDVVRYSEALAGGAPHEWAWSYAAAEES